MPPPEAILHLDLPKISPPNAEFEVKGWIASRAPIERVALERTGETIVMTPVDRPDVRKAITDFPFTTGFAGYGNVHFITADQLVFNVTTGGRVDRLPAVLKPFVVKPVNAFAGVPADDAAVKAAKFRRIAPYLICPACRVSVRIETNGCPGCGAKYHFSQGTLDFLTPEQAASIPAPGSTPASTGGFDEVAYSMIEMFRDGLVLDCGAGLKRDTHSNVINLEIMAYPSTDVRAMNEALPFADATFDAVFSFATLEHLRDPFVAGREIARVTKPGGLVYSVAPLISPYHGFPSHYYNMTLAGHEGIYPDSLEVLHSFVPLFGRPIYALTWILRDWVRGLPESHREEFLNLRVRDLATKPFPLLQQNYVRLLDADANMTLAANTAIIARKR